MVLVPVFAAHALSGLARTAIALALALPITPGVATALASTPMSAIDWITTGAKEIALGIAIACLVAVPFWAIEAAGTYLDYQRGGNPQALDPAASIDASVLGASLQQALVVFLIHSGGLFALFDIIWTSYAVWPALAPLPSLGDQAWAPVCHLLVSTMRWALTLAAPYLLALGAIEASFALLSRVNAKFPAYVAALPFKSVALLLLLALTLPSLLNAAADTAAGHLTEVDRSMRDAAPGRMSVKP